MIQEEDLASLKLSTIELNSLSDSEEDYRIS